jgi:hypothetical protein
LGDFLPVGRLLTRWAIFHPLGCFSPDWAIFNKLGDFSPVGRFFNRWEVLLWKVFLITEVAQIYRSTFYTVQVM